MAWDSGYIDPDAQTIFDEQDEQTQGRMVNNIICELKKKIRNLEFKNEELSERNKELEKCFQDILKLAPIKKHINKKLEKQRQDDAESERIARGYERENRWMMEHGGW